MDIGGQSTQILTFQLSSLLDQKQTMKPGDPPKVMWSVRGSGSGVYGLILLPSRKGSPVEA